MEEYNEKRRDEIETAARANNCEVVCATPKTLQLDLDTPQASEQFAQVLPILADIEELFELECGDVKTEEWASKSGVGKHVVIHLSKLTEVKERIMLQAMLGSDGKREALNLRQAMRGLDESIVLFRPILPIVTDPV